MVTRARSDWNEENLVAVVGRVAVVVVGERVTSRTGSLECLLVIKSTYT